MYELRLIAEAQFEAFPPRLEHQPIFHPVLTLEYATMIARDWNPKDEASGFVGFVTQFDVEDAFAGRYPVDVAGGRECTEVWVPAEELDDFNAHIVGKIEVIAAYPGAAFEGEVDPATHLPREG